MPVSATGLSPDVEIAVEFYENRLKPILEPQHNGRSVAIDAESREYELGDSHREAARNLKARLTRHSRIVTLTVGPPTPYDIALAQRMTGVR